MAIPVHFSEPIDSRATDYRVYSGSVDRDVRGTDGHLAIPRGSRVETIVRRTRDGLVLDLESVTVRGQRYAIDTDPRRVTGTAGHDDLLGSIVGTIKGGSGHGQAVHIPPNSTINFRLDRALTVNIPDRGRDRDGNHYHDYYGDHDRDERR